MFVCIVVCIRVCVFACVCVGVCVRACVFVIMYIMYIYKYKWLDVYTSLTEASSTLRGCSILRRRLRGAYHSG